MKSLALVLTFLTTLPVRLQAVRPGDLGRAAGWFPAVGLILGALLVVANWGLHWLFPPLLAAALGLAGWVALTGGLHLDGLADCGDGLLAAVAPERRLEIMRDPRKGTFGVVSLIIFLLLKWLALAALAQPYALLLAPVLARYALLWVARQRAARPGGLGAEFAHGLTRWTLLGAAIVPLALLVGGGARAGGAALAAGVVTVGVIGLARARLGGVTGDVLGLTVELVELAVLLVYAA